MRCLFALLVVALTLASVACDEAKSPTPAPTPRVEPEQDLTITYGGFISGGPEDQLLNGVCGTDATRNVVNCDVHNGLMNWNVTEVTFQIIVTGDNQQHYYRERVSIAPLQTEHASIRLGLQLPADDYVKYHGKPVGTRLAIGVGLLCKRKEHAAPYNSWPNQWHSLPLAIRTSSGKISVFLALECLPVPL